MKGVILPATAGKPAVQMFFLSIWIKTEEVGEIPPKDSWLLTVCHISSEGEKTMTNNESNKGQNSGGPQQKTSDDSSL